MPQVSLFETWGLAFQLFNKRGNNNPKTQVYKPNLGHPIRDDSLIFLKLRRSDILSAMPCQQFPIPHLRATRPFELGRNGEKMTRSGVGIMVAFLLASLPSGWSAGQDPCSTEQTPARVRELLKDKFPGWEIVTLQHLNPDDQKTWKKTNPSKCPGYTTGDYQGTGHPSYAFGLFRKNEKTFFQTLLVIDPDGEDYKLHVLSKPQEVVIPNVVTTQPPGIYTDFYETKRIKTACPVISYEQLDSGQLIYYWSNGRYHSIQTSD